MTFIQNAKPAAFGFSPAVTMRAGAPDTATDGETLVLRDAATDALHRLPAQNAGARQAFRQLDTYITEEDRAFWYFLKPLGRPSFSCQLLAELADMQEAVKRSFSDGRAPFDYAILGSRGQAVFSLGGDLGFFAEKIRQRDRTALRQYAHACVAVVHANHTGIGDNVTTIAMLQGDALGGGFEAALSCDVLIAERQAKFGLPEVLFNLLPGMGAYSLLSRRVGMLKAEQIILSGRTHTAEEMLALGAIDMVVDEGDGEQAVRDYIARNRTRQLALSTLLKIRRRVNPVSREELLDVTEMWVDAAMRLSEHDLRRMCRIASAQDRFNARSANMTQSAAR